MQINAPYWQDAETHLAQTRPDHPVLYFSPRQLGADHARFQAGFDGLVTFAVKANPTDAVLQNLLAGGMTAFDVASPVEMALVRRLSADAALHYNNPVRSDAEVAAAIAHGVGSYAVDCIGELDKLSGVAPGTEVSVRLHLPIAGAVYHFGDKFGAAPAEAEALLQQVAARGLTPSMTFHPGTQCQSPEAWTSYIAACADIAGKAGVTLHRLNVGGGFPAHRDGDAPDLTPFFAGIHQAVRQGFADRAPGLVCEPGRAMVAEAFRLALRIKAIRPDGSVFLTDGVYGLLSEARDMTLTSRITVVTPGRRQIAARRRPRVVFGPTCDSLDRLPHHLILPEDLQEGDYLLFDGVGAYSTATATAFNGYGAAEILTLT